MNIDKTELKSVDCNLVNLYECSAKVASFYVEKWHSVLPRCPTFLVHGTCFIAYTQGGSVCGVAVWSNPIARMLNGKGYYELRRLAVSPDAPRNTCTAMLAGMRKHIHANKPEIKAFLSYQDQDAHLGTIYKADNWSVGWVSTRSTSKKSNWSASRENRGEVQSSAKKTAWVKEAK